MKKNSIDKVIGAFKVLNIYDLGFFEFIKSRVSYFPDTDDFCPWACFPVIDNNTLKDIKVIVPVITNEKTLLINIHEFYHAYELYQELGFVYQDNLDIREESAKRMEKEYLKIKNNSES